VEREGKKRDKETKRQREKDRKGRQSCCWIAALSVYVNFKLLLRSDSSASDRLRYVRHGKIHITVLCGSSCSTTIFFVSCGIRPRKRICKTLLKVWLWLHGSDCYSPDPWSILFASVVWVFPLHKKKHFVCLARSHG
jgi:hypothetical protein